MRGKQWRRWLSRAALLLSLLAGILFFAVRYRNDEFFQRARLEKKPAWENDWMALPVFPETDGASSSG